MQSAGVSQMVSGGLLGEDKRQAFGTTISGVSVPPDLPAVVEPQVGHPPKKRPLGDLRFLQGKRSAQAAVRTVPEAQDLPWLPRDIEAVGVGKACAVAIGRGDAELHYLSFPYDVPAQLEVLQGDPGYQGDRRLEAQRLLEGAAQELRIFPDRVELVRMRQEQVDRVAGTELLPSAPRALPRARPRRTLSFGRR